MVTSLPQLRQARLAGEEQRETTRQWKRLKRLENDLGFTNLVRTPGREQALPHDGDHDHHDHATSRHRKRRLSAVRTLATIEGLIPSRLPEKQSIPWTQPVGQRRNVSPASTAENDLRHSSEPPQLAGRAVATHVSDQRFKFKDRTDGIDLGSMCPTSQEEWTTGQSAHGMLSSRGNENQKPTDHGGRDCSLGDDGNFLRSEGSFGRQARRDGKSQEWKGLSKTCRDAPESLEEARDELKALDKPGVLRNIGDQPSRGNYNSGPAGVTNPPAIVVRASSRPKLSAVRSALSRSLVSPKNPLTSSTVVARVKEGLQNGGEQRPKVLLVGSGIFNPVHKLHIRRFYLAREFLEADMGMRVVGGIVSPSHPTLVRQRHRVRAAEIIPPKHRLSMARAAVGKRSWLVVDPWEVTRKRIMDYMSVLEHAKEVCHETFPGHAGDITILYMCQASQMYHLNPALLRAGGYGVITVCRPLEKERLLKELSPSFRNIVNVVEDGEILGAELEKISSTMVRHLLKQGKPVGGMVGRAVARYIQDNNIAERVSGRQKWTVEDKAFMFEQEDKEDRPYHNLPRVHVRRASQMPLQY